MSIMLYAFPLRHFSTWQQFVKPSKCHLLLPRKGCSYAMDGKCYFFGAPDMLRCCAMI
ncbi:hypothetical protein M5D96_002199 [Drosophila gunungcola]|uniref:Uncharacterized protein n=1 Tax=Drosophila gunungcola TaxID=103775 RepID=A0A9P9YZK4_9MUSC|nr:hypothetical protein M5D96_002199 [Drosophila gunungcola]